MFLIFFGVNVLVVEIWVVRISVLHGVRPLNMAWCFRNAADVATGNNYLLVKWGTATMHTIYSLRGFEKSFFIFWNETLRNYFSSTMILIIQRPTCNYNYYFFKLTLEVSLKKLINIFRDFFVCFCQTRPPSWWTAIF